MIILWCSDVEYFKSIPQSSYCVVNLASPFQAEFGYGFGNDFETPKGSLDNAMLWLFKDEPL